MPNAIITAYHNGTLTSVHHFSVPHGSNLNTLHAYIRATTDATSLRTEYIPAYEARRLPVDWLQVPAEFTQALARVADKETPYKKQKQIVAKEIDFAARCATMTPQEYLNAIHYIREQALARVAATKRSV